MRIPLSAFIVIVVVIGFLTGATVYFYSQSRIVTQQKAQQDKRFDGETVTELASPTPTKVDELTVPAEPKNRLSYPANTYRVAPLEGLFVIAQKMAVPTSMIKLANSIVNENVLQAGDILVIPKLYTRTDSYRILFLINDDRATELNRELKDENSSDFFDPIVSAKKQAKNYFGIKDEHEFSLLEQDKSKGTALVEAKQSETVSNLIGLVQPKKTGDKGLWVVLYIEHRDKDE